MGLYDEDIQYPNPLYDSETGRTETAAHVDLVDIASEEAILTGEALQSMRDSQGFKILEKFLSEQVTQVKDSLPYQTDQAKLLRLQEMVKCYQNVLDYVEHQIRVGQFHKRGDNLK